MEENELQTIETDSVETPDSATSPIAYVKSLRRSERLQNNAMQPDYSIPELKTTDMAFKESTMQLTAPEIENIMRNSGLKGSAWEQTGVAVENALIGMNNLPEELSISIGNLANYISGGQIGKEMQDVAYESLDNRMATMQLNEESVGGIRSLMAKLAGGATSFAQLALESVATAGILPSAQIGIQTFGEGTYNDMKKYADEHDGSLKGYEPKGVDVAINTANTLFQVGSEAWLGVGSPRFMRGWSRGFVKEAGSGFVQESLQDIVQDFAEVAKGNKEFEDMLNNADQYVIDGVIGVVLQGPLGAATHSQARRRSDNIVARAHAIAKGRKTPNKQDFDVAKRLNDAKERNYASALTTEFKAQFDASTGEGQLQANIANALNKAIETQELDLGIADETERAQKVEAIATQETLNALEMAQEQGKSVSEMELNNVVYRDGAIWLEGETPQVGERAVDYTRVLAERQSGLAQAQTKLDALTQEVQQTKAALIEARAASKEALAQKLQARLEKQQALEEKRRQETERLKKQTEKLQQQIESRMAEESKQEEVAPIEIPVTEVQQMADTDAIMALEQAVADNTIKLSELELAQWQAMNEQKPAEQKAETGVKPVQAQKADFARSMLAKYTPEKDTIKVPQAKSQMPKVREMAKVADKLKKPVVEKRSIKVVRKFKQAIKALREIVGGKEETTVKDLRDDLTQYGGTNDVSFVWGNNKKGIVHIVENHGSNILPRVFDAVVDGRIKEAYPNNKVIIEKNGVDVVLKLTEFGKAKSWVVTGYDTTISKDAEREFRATQRATQGLPTFGRQDLGALLNESNIAPTKADVKAEKTLKQSKAEGAGSDKYRGAYDERLKRIILGEKSDLTTIQHEFAHYWVQNNFKWARSGLASQDWLRRWRDVEEALGIEPQDRYLSKRASEKFARAYERYIMEGKYSDDLKWAFDGFQKFYNDTYEDLENEYFDLSEELDPKIVDWFNRQRPVSGETLKEQAYKKVATVAMAQGAEIATPVSDAGMVVSSMDSDGNVQTEMLVSEKAAQESKLAKYSGKKKKSRVEEGLSEATKGAVESREYNVLNRAQTIEQAQQWIANDQQGAWNALTSNDTNIIDRAALYQAFKQMAENGDYALGVELANTQFPKQMTEIGQAVSTLGERAEFDPMTILENKQKSLGAPTESEVATQTAEMGLDTGLTDTQAQELEQTTECVL